MKLALVQMDVRNGDRRANLQSISRRLKHVSADLVVLPELASSGYLFKNRRALRKLAEYPSPGSPTYDLLFGLSRSTGAVIVAGFPEKDGSKIYNSAMVVGSKGLLGVYRKVHLFDREHLIFDPGDTGFKTWKVKGTTVGVMICFDWIFPESARTLAMSGAQVIAHPANLVLPYFQDAAITRALENRVFVATANRIGTEEVGDQRLTFTGRSQLVSPRGEVVGRAPGKAPRTLLFEIDPLLAKDKMLTQRDHVLKRRRPGFYRLT